MDRPVLTVIAGPNGSGKSTLIAYLRKNDVDFGTYINADDIAKELGLIGDEGAAHAQQIADEQRAESLKSGKTFSFETVMSHQSKVEFMQKARAADFKVQLFFVATGNPDININRVRGRVAAGGHDVPEDRIVKRYWRTLGLLTDAILASDNAVIFDNSPNGEGNFSPEMLRPIASSKTSLYQGEPDSVELQFISPVTMWTLDSLKFAGHGFGMTGCSKNQNGLTAFMSKLRDTYPDATERDAEWHATLVDILLNS